MLEKYKFIKYNPKFSNLFLSEKIKLSKIIKNAKIEHIGSSSVEGLGGKGIIDLDIAVGKKELLKNKEILLKNGYIFKESGGNKERLFFEKDYNLPKKTRRVHVHLTFIDSKEWKNDILVRDYLRKNKNSREDYTKIKKEGVKFAKGEGKKYREYKHKFLQGLINKAKKELK